MSLINKKKEVLDNDGVYRKEVEELCDELKIGDYVFVNALPSGFISKTYSVPIYPGTNFLSDRRPVVMVKTKEGTFWSAPLHMCTKLDENEIDDEMLQKMK